MNNPSRAFRHTPPGSEALIAGVCGQRIGRVWSHRVTIGSVALAFFLSLLGFKDIVIDGEPAFNQAVYTCLSSDGLNFHFGFLIDKLSVTICLNPCDA